MRPAAIMEPHNLMIQVLRGGLIILLFGVSTSPVLGAYLYIAPERSTVFRGDTETLAVRIDTDEGECINVVDATLTYPSNVRAVDVSRGDSILSVWLEDPVIDQENRTITFAGGIPGGYCGRIAGDPRLTNVIAELVFRSPGLNIGSSGEPEARIEFTDATQVLLHDGLGTPAILSTSGATLVLDDNVGNEIADDWTGRIEEDDIPPADFRIILSKDENAFSEKYFIVFNSIDKQSGIDRYEVMEEPFDEFELFKWGAADAPWERAQSPYVLKDQTLNSTIRVRAIDKAGNETIVVLIPDEAIRSLSLERVMFIGAVSFIALIVIGGIMYALWRRKEELDNEYKQLEESHNEE